MSLWVPLPDLQPGEQVRWRRRANRLQNHRRAVAGRLILTSQRLLFVPNLLERVIGGGDWACRTAEIREVSVEDPVRRPVFGQVASWRRLLKLQSASGEQRFVLNSAGQAADELRRLLRTLS